MSFLNQELIAGIFDRQKAFLKERKTSDIEFRKTALQSLKTSINAHRQEIRDALKQDLGKPQQEADDLEIFGIIEEIDQYLAKLDEWTQPEIAENYASFLDYQGKPPVQSWIEREPFGLVFIIGPFNYPLNLVLSPLVGALAAGNLAIVKPSESVPNIAAVIEKIIQDAFEPEYVAIVRGGRTENEILLKLPFNMIFFTGSPGVGKVVMKAAAENLTPVVLELGGKSPFIVLGDADLDRAADRVVQGRFMNSGQTCIAPDYALVDARVKDEFLRRVVDRAQASFPSLGSTGKVVSTAQVEQLQVLIARSSGTVVTGGKADPAARTLEATVVDGVDWSDSLMEQELFAPILPILTFDDVQDVADLVNAHHPNPLAAYYFTSDVEAGKRLSKLIPSGDAVINGVMLQVVSPYLAFGGIGTSGMGEYHGRSGFEVFTHRKSVVIAG